MGHLLLAPSKEVEKNVALSYKKVYYHERKRITARKNRSHRELQECPYRAHATVAV